MDNIYGKKFRELRKQQNITLQKAADGITSKSTLSLWEMGKDNLSFNQVLMLLNKINIQPIEFLENPVSPELLDITHKIDSAYIASDIDTLYKYVTEKRALFNSHPQELDYFIEYCFACTFYQDLSQNKSFTDLDKKRLTSIMSNISEWNYKTVFYFGNTLGLLTPHNINRLANSLITYSLNHKLNHKRWYDEVLAALLNSIAVLLKRDYHLAENLMNNFEKLPISDRFAFEKMHIRLYRAVIKYIKTKDDQDVKAIIYTTKILDLKTIEDGFVTFFDQIKQIYD
ncbi:helix-turn-helix domain-containing protein [Lactobacillus kalixensis]|uniref:Transcriptional regulator n=1 Tax=Lactobacillus kalixensis DSM 16043 TaxID=1423763 RepID=A0A0R1UDL3_9LACO|nr:Rgg/GadR/MutR family transcriptional regulator [Lactobacillus kalixensis]KRL91536.1 transcriptional regulator [Lactobacillus kalixensis DSM 16043]